MKRCVIACFCLWSASVLLAEPVLDVGQMTLQSDGSFDVQVAPQQGLTPNVKALPLASDSAPVVTSPFNIPPPPSTPFRFASMSNAQLTQYCLVREKRMLYDVRRISSIRISLAFLRQKLAAAQANGTATQTALKSVASIRTSLQSELSSRLADFKALRPNVQQALREQKRRGMAVRDLPALMNSAISAVDS